MTAPGPLFDAAFHARAPERAPNLACRAEHADDRAFLLDLFAACSPMAAMLPAPMLHQQAALQYDAYAGSFAHAMRRIAMLGDVPIGRVIVDWSTGGTHCVDIAVLPDHRPTGAGPLLLEAWLATADTLGVPATLEVHVGNPAARLYRRLGFVAVADDDSAVMIAMTRAVGASSPA